MIIFALAMHGIHAEAAVNLQWRISPTKLFVGDTVEVGLYAVSDDGVDQTVAGIDAIVSWDPTVLELTGLINNGPHDWLASWFPDDSKLDGLNAPFNDGDPTPGNDGDALYQAVLRAAPEPPAIATLEGLLVTTFVFTAINDSFSTELTFLPQPAGENTTTVTRVLTNDPVGMDITGTLGFILIEILPCGFFGDIDFDCGIDLDDYRQFFPCMTGPDRIVQIVPCLSSDLDGDQHVDLKDYQIFQLLFNGN